MTRATRRLRSALRLAASMVIAGAVTFAVLWAVMPVFPAAPLVVLALCCAVRPAQAAWLRHRARASRP